MILTCELCQNQFLTESDPHVVIPGKETKIYCSCQVKRPKEMAKRIRELESENAKLNQEIEKFKSYLEAWGSNEL
jgi:methylphosphotriester-DNA--protein-cysteine methyltransferase